MANIIMENDKSTTKDELILLLIILGCFLAGGLLMVYRPAFWFITSVHTGVLGAILVLTGTMLIPGFLYRLLENNKR